MMSAGWDGGRTSKSIVARHEWKGLSKMSYSLEDWGEKQRIERNERASMRARRLLRIPGSFDEEEEY
jgi:WD repeat-containing protein 23